MWATADNYRYENINFLFGLVVLFLKKRAWKRIKEQQHDHLPPTACKGAFLPLFFSLQKTCYPHTNQIQPALATVSCYRYPDHDRNKKREKHTRGVNVAAVTHVFDCLKKHSWHAVPIKYLFAAGFLWYYSAASISQSAKVSELYIGTVLL